MCGECVIAKPLAPTSVRPGLATLEGQRGAPAPAEALKQGFRGTGSGVNFSVAELTAKELLI